jgi:hypothetical protein
MGTSFTVSPDSITFAKMQNVSASTLLGRGDSGAGDPQEITLGSGLSMSGTTLSASAGGGGGSPWDLAGSWTFSMNVAQVDFTGLAGATDIMIIARQVTQSVSTQLALRVSTNNGSSFFSASGDYIILAPASGAEANSSAQIFWNTGATAARSGMVTIVGANVIGAPRPLLNPDTSSGNVRLFVADTANDIDAVRVIPSGGGNITGGSIYVFTR